LHSESETELNPSAANSPTRIGIAVVESDGCFLVGCRAADVPLPGLAEFPGGKCESDETPRSCAVRECREETGLVVIPQEQLATVAHSYAHGNVELHFWKCGLGPGPSNYVTPVAPFRWVPLRELAELEFPAANRTVLDRLLSQQLAIEPQP
jgi:8-oxo-dGTP diphosphatase